MWYENTAHIYIHYLRTVFVYLMCYSIFLSSMNFTMLIIFFFSYISSIETCTIEMHRMTVNQILENTFGLSNVLADIYFRWQTFLSLVGYFFFFYFRKLAGSHEIHMMTTTRRIMHIFRLYNMLANTRFFNEVF